VTKRWTRCVRRTGAVLSVKWMTVAGLSPAAWLGPGLELEDASDVQEAQVGAWEDRSESFEGRQLVDSGHVRGTTRLEPSLFDTSRQRSSEIRVLVDLEAGRDAISALSVFASLVTTRVSNSDFFQNIIYTSFLHITQ
jgi:hypothetical protein